MIVSREGARSVSVWVSIAASGVLDVQEGDLRGQSSGRAAEARAVALLNLLRKVPRPRTAHVHQRRSFVTWAIQ